MSNSLAYLACNVHFSRYIMQCRPDIVFWASFTILYRKEIKNDKENIVKVKIIIKNKTGINFRNK